MTPEAVSVGEGTGNAGGVPPVNCHAHDDASSDGTGALAEHAEAARRAGLRHFCTTNHVEVLEEDGSWTVSLEEAARRFRAERAEGRRLRRRLPELDVRVGAEFEYRPGWTDVLDALAREVDLDMVIGSVHVVDGLNVSGGPEPDRYFASRSRAEAYRGYFETVGEMVAWGGFDVVGHFDLVARYGHDHHGPYEPGAFEDVIRPVLAEMARKGLGIEVNTSGVAQAPGEPYPRTEILAWAREEGVPFLTLGADSHVPRHVARGLAEGARAARTAGWDEVTVLAGRRPAATLPLAPAREAS